MFISACAAQHLDSAGTASDEHVIRAVLETIAAKAQSRTYLIAAETEPYKRWLEPNPRRALDTPIRAGFVKVYANANREHRPVPTAALPGRFALIDALQIRQHFQHGPREGWEALEATYGARTGVIRISWPTYCRRSEEALITYSYDYAPLGGETNYVILRRVNGEWKVVAVGHLALS